MLSNFNTCLLTLSKSTVAVISENGHYAVVDSHARNAFGMADVNGRSVITYFSSIHELYNHVCCLCVSLGAREMAYEIASVFVAKTQYNNVSED